MSKFLEDKRNIVIALLIILFLIKAPQEGRRFVFWIFGGILLCATLDHIINKLFLGRIIIPKSASITGIIVSGILDYHQPWHILVIFSLLAIIPKHIIKFNRRHIFNPANLALFLAALFKIPLTWNIESNIFLIIVIGLYLTYSLKKYFHVIGFLLFFMGLSLIGKINPFSMVSWFFVFIMLIEPKTSGYGKLRGLVFGGIAGISSFLVFKFLPHLNYMIASLVVANFANPILDKAEKKFNVAS